MPRADSGGFYGWRVVAACGVMALFAWGVGFYGLGVYLVTLRDVRGLSPATISAAITLQFFAGAGMVALAGPVFERLGPRTAVGVGGIAYALALCGIALAEGAFALFAAFLVLALGWGLTSLAAINIVLAPWFERRRGFALSLALTGASLGGVVGAPALVLSIEALGFERGLFLAAFVTAATLLALARWALVRDPRDVGQAPDGDAVPTENSAPAAPGERRGSLRETLRRAAFWTITLPLAIALTVQVGVLTHQIAILEPELTRTGAAFAVSLTGAAAVLGRLMVGMFVDRLPRRAIAAANCAMQALALVVIAHTRDAWLLYLGFAVYGLGVGTLISLPGLLVQREFPAAQFARVTSLVVSLCQLSYSTGPLLLGWASLRGGGYSTGLAVGALALLAAAAVLLRGAPPRVGRISRADA